MEGYLKIFVLRELLKKERTGYQLMKEFGDFTGNKPSPGTVYPLLNSLLKKELVCVSAVSNKKIYRITRKGEKILKELMFEKKNAFENITKMLSTTYSKEEIKGIRKRISVTLSILSGERHNLTKEIDIIRDLKDSIFSFVSSDKYTRKRDEFRRIVHETSRKIKNLGEKNG